MRLSDLTGDNRSTLEIAGISADSREIGPGFLFAAFPGAASDGANFIEDAVKKGAVAVLALPGTKVPPGAVLIADENPRRRFAQMAANLYGRQPGFIAAVTGTNGKTSTVHFFRHLWKALGKSSASLGTLGVASDTITRSGTLTTPDAQTLARDAAELDAAGVTHLAVEASSHGLDQFRLDGLNLRAAAFTNLTRDHLDYHKTMEAYKAAKFRLFEELLPADGVAIINADTAEFADISAVCARRGQRVLSYGRNGRDIKLLDQKPLPHGQYLSLSVMGKKHDVEFPLAGDFQAGNALAALGLVLAESPDDAEFCQRAVRALENLPGVRGRLELAGTHPVTGAAVYVDYAHTPDGLKTVLESLRPHTAKKLHVVFGCGGDRDRGKRPEMGRIAQKLADRVIVTDDNPRTENAQEIRAEVMAGCTSALEIADRKEAIAKAIAGLGAGDILVIAGKGHEQGQIIGRDIRPFDDAAVAKTALEEHSMNARPNGRILFTAGEAEAATQGRATRDFDVSGVTLDSRAIVKGDLFIALKGPSFDGHDFVEAAIKAGASGAVVNAAFRPGDDSLPLIRVNDTQQALEDLGRAARDRTMAKIIGVTGSVGKTSTKEMLAIALSALGPAHASKKSFNNHWGVPLTLSSLPRDAAFGVFEMGMNHAGELTVLSDQVKPDVAIITTIEAAHIGHFASVDDIASAKAEIFNGMKPGAIAVLNADNPHFAQLKAAADAKGLKVLTFGEDDSTHARLVDCALQSDGTRVTAKILGQEVKYRLSIPGKHVVMNSLAALLAIAGLGLDLGPAIEALKNAEPVEGRGNKIDITIAEGMAPVTIIDESYNANPASMKAAFEVLTMAQPRDKNGRRIAVLGDMLELGPQGPKLHAELANPLLKAKTDKVFTCGPLMDALYQTLPEDWRGAHADDSIKLAAHVCEAVRPGDVVLIKGSAGSKMAYIIKALSEKSVNRNEPKKKDKPHAL